MLTEKEQHISESISAERATLYTDLAEHVAIPTGQGYRPGLDRYRAIIAGRLAAIGASIEEVDGRERPAWLDLPGETGSGASGSPPTVLVARHPAADGAAPRLLIVGHLDTVHPPDGDFRALTLDPGDDRIARGPGAVDMKGGVLIATCALEALHRARIDIGWTFLLNSDEETGSFQSEHVLRDEGAKHEVGLVLEPALADGSLAIERMGSGQFKVEVFGRSAHVGRAFDEGISAVTKLGEILCEIARMAEPQCGVIVNVGPVQGGHVTNAVPDYAACWGNVRYQDAGAGEEVAIKLDALQCGAEAKLPRVVVHRHWNRPAKPCTAGVEQVALHARCVAEDLGQQLPFATTGGVCDGNILQDAGLPTLDTLGVRGGNLHRTDEFVEVSSLVERAQLLAVLLVRLSQPAKRSS